jgi:hypothetical protein
MATKKKPAKSKKKSSKKKVPKKPVRKAAASKKKLARKKPAPKRAAAKTRVSAKRSTPKKAPRRSPAQKSPGVDTSDITREGLRSRSGGQSGDLQGLSNIASAESESVDELLEEGNSFEADVVKGVEDAGDEGEVHTHEVPEDDVPEEYLDKD